jgi:hypothetical protein
MGILDDNELQLKDILLIFAYSVNVTLITTIHPWLANSYPTTLKNRLQKSVIWNTIFAFTFSYSVTRDIALASFVLIMHLVMRQCLLRYA